MTLGDPEKATKYILQETLCKHIVSGLGESAWIIVADIRSSGMDDVAYYSALVPVSRTRKVLERDDWDLHVGDGGPAIITSYHSTRTARSYRRCGHGGTVEPLVYYREFHGIKPGSIEVCEDFRLLFGLYHDHNKDVLVRFSDAGNEEEVVRLHGKRVEIRARELREYLSLRRMRLAIYFECIRRSRHSLEELGLAETREVFRGADYVYSFALAPDVGGLDGSKTLSVVRGKKLIRPISRKRAAKEKFEKFIIGVDERGRPKTYTCDHNKLANYFGANPHAPMYVTPVFFRKDVLQKYYAQPSKYSVEDGYLRCGGMWGMRMDNDRPDYVIVLLGDLGRDLPEEERPYWRSFNVPPDGGMSMTAFKRGILGEFANPTKPDLAFKMTFKRFQHAWRKTFGWFLFKPLRADDEHYYTSLRVPATEEQAELDGQILALAKLLVDSLNEKMLVKDIDEPEANARGISKLEVFLRHRGITGYEGHIAFLRNLYALRSSGVGHRKGKNYEKAMATFRRPKMGNTAIFENILQQACDLLDYLESVLPALAGHP